MAEDAAAPAPRVDFYVLAGSDARARLLFACRIAEKAYLAGQRLFVRLDDAGGVQLFDELLWTFGDRSFVPHETFADDAQWQETPVLLGCGAEPTGPFDVLMNLGTALPASAGAARIIEIIDADPERRQAGRTRFRRYRDQGAEPATHPIGGPGDASG